MTSSKLDSLVFKLLIKTCRWQGRFWARSWWRNLHDKFLARGKTIQVTMHNRLVFANFGYTYPFTARYHSSFNSPLLELVSTVRQQRNRPVRFLDVGAAIGDTVLLVDSNCIGMVAEYICVDGDPEFFGYLEANLSSLPNIRCVLHQLSRSARFSPALVRTHAGTASAQGSISVPTAPLDEVISALGVGPIDVLKIDVDGFDGEVLAGAETILNRDQPGVIFEWHPILCKQTGNDWTVAFETLRKCGYRHSAWFTKFGTFSHFASLDDLSSFRDLAEFCLTTTTFGDWHFDVLCLPGDDTTMLKAAADLPFGRHRKSPY